LWEARHRQAKCSPRWTLVPAPRLAGSPWLVARSLVPQRRSPGRPLTQVEPPRAHVSRRALALLVRTRPRFDRWIRHIPPRPTAPPPWPTWPGDAAGSEARPYLPSLSTAGGQIEADPINKCESLPRSCQCSARPTHDLGWSAHRGDHARPRLCWSAHRGDHSRPRLPRIASTCAGMGLALENAKPTPVPRHNTRTRQKVPLFCNRFPHRFRLS